jgi:hypothetical protein
MSISAKTKCILYALYISVRQTVITTSYFVIFHIIFCLLLLRQYLIEYLRYADLILVKHTHIYSGYDITAQMRLASVVKTFDGSNAAA